ncbi:UDP-N-acetylmuramoyl-tripeptide--D-alanyl-D-alanine ligase [Sandaracinus amylolyticus]|uniref:UDP-N-acetylmuramoyl-tripeptide--D-alanyl-D- alanine ligase n=1 Tax=Sandaracinus amylolyticus TaxID=927083 RepID=UPI001F3EE37C|nr:UDP-N-acetylmuramoyl-tripeptide--D-alanyl-D-alanine ligase [Sandaracinus amylolyticus]UJR80111.1 UDP-N-acetylmuramoyl-tripeptide--D-alanyl-D-alanine ligase [Sandaracinus amylolyticus]
MATPIPANSARFSIDELAVATRGTVAASTDRPLVGVVTDSRAVTPGCIFVALRGAKHDAHDFVATVIAAGAGALVVSQPVSAPAGVAVVIVPDTLRALGDLALAHRRRFPIPLVAVTGSVGKTTTKELTAAGLEALGLRVLRSAGNLNNRIGVPMTLFTLGPDHDVVVIEMGMNVPGEIARLTEIAAPSVGVVTAVAEVHTEGVGGIEGVAREKGALLLGLDEEAAAVFTADDGILAPYAERSPARTKLSFGLAEGTDVRLADLQIELDGTRCVYVVRGLNEFVNAKLALIGEGPARCGAAAIAAIVALRGADAVHVALEGIQRVAPGEGRARPVPGVGGTIILDDAYNASPRSTELALRTCCELARVRGGRAVAVLGDMLELGVESERLHESVGEAAVASGVALLVCCGPEMRAAARGALTAGMASGVSGIRIERLDDPTEAIALVRAFVEPNDVILVKGSRSMRMERVVEGLREVDAFGNTAPGSEEAPR